MTRWPPFFTPDRIDYGMAALLLLQLDPRRVGRPSSCPARSTTWQPNPRRGGSGCGSWFVVSSFFPLLHGGRRILCCGWWICCGGGSAWWWLSGFGPRVRTEKRAVSRPWTACGDEGCPAQVCVWRKGRGSSRSSFVGTMAEMLAL